MFTDTNTQPHIGDVSSSSTAIYSKAYNLNKAISRAQDKLLSLQDKDGNWVFELEADCTIPSEYILMMHYLGEIDELLQAKIANYLRSRQSKDGSYPLFTGGPGDISCSVKVYYALKLAGDSPDATHMTRLRNYILSRGGLQKPMFLRALRWQPLSSCLGAGFLIFQWKSCCFPAGFRFI